jgi:hypothetical protein
MIDISPVHAAAVLALLITYKLTMWLACRAIDGLNVMGPRERRARPRHIYQERCSTMPEPSRFELVAIIFAIDIAGVVALLSATWLGQEFIEYLARAVWAARPN